ncbi:MAG: MFS transporter [Planctomycetota bacterium]
MASAAEAEPPVATSRLSRNVLVLGLVSLFADIGSEMVFPLLPYFLTTTLGGGALVLAIVEGIADSVAAVLRFLAGRHSDRTGRCRPYVIGGYAVAAMTRPLFAIAGAPWHVAGARALDRVGKGLRTTPRDALIASSVPPERRAWAFGFHRSMDHLGAAIGPLVAFALLTFVTTDLRTVFFAALIPGAFAAVLAWALVRELPPDLERAGKPKKLPNGSLRRFLIPVGVFSLGAASDEFLLLRLGQSTDVVTTLPLLWCGLHVVRSLAAAPAGRLADAIGRTRMLSLGWSLHVLVFLGFAFVDSHAGLIVLFLLHGLRSAMTEGAEKAIVAHLAPSGTRGVAFAWYHLVLAFAPRLLFGGIWQFLDADTAFLTAAGFATAGITLLLRASR